MKQIVPLFVGETKAAKLLDIKLADFRTLVQHGVLPRGNRLGNFERWDVELLKSIVSGAHIANAGEVEW
ncbi:hypothetical protein ROA7450_00200 [Roseovarius albus]|uniref:Uncharacterized protein n=1 Tax=Roseovarius albus TaxID=1247867 RepID=A0A1X6Y8Q7_9RHOB|nr:hypothetical protein [Roseovarius albus]SLN13615.1 hypothetical protein ROA7450_00200 [Roseovarius albus]